MATSDGGITSFFKEFGETDLYLFLGVSTNSSVKEITTAYRKQALKYHPDKNTDESSSAMFRKLTSVYSILTDLSARAAYDTLVRTRLASEKRRQEYSAKRRKLMEDLERREKEGSLATTSEEVAMTKMDQEIARLRKEGEERLKAETELLREEISRNSLPSEDTCILKLRWKCSKDGKSVYSKESLTEIFSKYGSCTVVVSEKKGRAVVELTTGPWTFDALNEVGLVENQLKTEWLRQPTQSPSFTHTVDSQAPDPLVTTRDYESLTLMKLRQAEDRKNIIEKLEQEENINT